MSPVELGRERAQGKINDIVKITDMLIYQGHGLTSPAGENAYRPQHWYTCKHFDDATGSCTDYENRPRMCSEYPYGKRCRHDGCGYNDAGGADWPMENTEMLADRVAEIMEAMDNKPPLPLEMEAKP